MVRLSKCMACEFLQDRKCSMTGERPLIKGSDECDYFKCDDE